uniref:ABC transporter domain-containing protein n=1 Tax=Timema poppense TaxID=170557 RepID=A0A7R9D0B9_TIMPO|nr:unnamed protein product [Timema poppensis]
MKWGLENYHEKLTPMYPRVIGQPGSGKKAIVYALFRLMEPSAGKVCIGGTNIAGVPLGKLRSSISIVSQDPILFAGTLKLNIDPKGQYNDEDIWDCLQQVGLLEKVTKLPLQLNTKILGPEEGWTSGEKQLLGLARALLTNVKWQQCEVWTLFLYVQWQECEVWTLFLSVQWQQWRANAKRLHTSYYTDGLGWLQLVLSPLLILEESLETLSPAVEERIHSSVKDYFSSSTVIIIAHRLQFVKNCDKVMAIHNGKVAEFDTPSKLYRNTKSTFSQIMAASVYDNFETEL